MNRDISIDLLRFVGLSCIIFAHIDAPFVLNQLRCFDVPLMLFVSGLTCSGRSIPDYFGYMLNQNESFTKEMKDDLIVVLSRAVGSMFMSNEELKEAGFTNGEFIKETEKEDNKD